MTNQVKIIVAVVVVAALLGLVAFTQLGKSSESPQEATVSKESETAQSAKGSLKSLLGAGKNVNCTFSYPDAGSTGTVYVSGQRMRGDFNMMVEGKTMESHMIQDETYVYSWTGSQGAKFKIEETLKASPVPGGQQQNVDLDKEVDYKCSPWAANNSMFSVPTDVTFTDMSEMMKQVPSQTGNQGTQPSACDQITDPQAKAACVSATSGN